MPSNLKALPDNIQENREMVRIYRSSLSGKWYVDEDDVPYPVSVALGGYTWAVETENFCVVFDVNFRPYSVYVTNHKIDRITDPFGNEQDEFYLTKGGDHIRQFWKSRAVGEKIDRVCISHRWDRQLYGSEEGRQGAQVKYTLGW